MVLYNVHQGGVMIYQSMGMVRHFFGRGIHLLRFADVLVMFQCSELKDSILPSLVWWFYCTGLSIVICIMQLVCIFL